MAIGHAGCAPQVELGHTEIFMDAIQVIQVVLFGPKKNKFETQKDERSRYGIASPTQQLKVLLYNRETYSLGSVG
jgi:hypothetical protein